MSCLLPHCSCIQSAIVDFHTFCLTLMPGQFEIREAMALKKPMVLVHESDTRFGAFDFEGERNAAPKDLQSLLDQHEPLPFRRRGFERDGMLAAVIQAVGFKDLLESAQKAKSSSQTAKLTVALPVGAKNHFFLSHAQATGKCTLSVSIEIRSGPLQFT